MRKITVEGIEINFNDLTEKKQRELYEKNKKKYKEDASKSIYSEIRKTVAKDETESSEFLNRMLREEISEENDRDVMGAIFYNTIFEIEEETIIALATSRYPKNRVKAAKLSKNSKLLNQMLRNEIIDKQNDRVYDAIFNNEFFEIEEKTIGCLATSDKWQYRKKAAELSKDSKFLNQMFRKEINGDQNSYVENAIFDNEFFEIEEETIICLAKSNDWEDRKKAAELSKDSKFLNQMLRKEAEEQQVEDVYNAILNKDVFEVEEETLEILKTSDYGVNRKIAAELLKDPDSLLEMFVNEFRNYVDAYFSDVMEAIIENEAFIFEKTKLLEHIRDNY